MFKLGEWMNIISVPDWIQQFNCLAKYLINRPVHVRPTDFKLAKTNLIAETIIRHLYHVS